MPRSYGGGISRAKQGTRGHGLDFQSGSRPTITNPGATGDLDGTETGRTYVDATVLAAYYAPHSASAEVQKALQDSPGPAVSLLTEVELAAALGHLGKKDDGDPGKGRRLLRLFRRHRELGVFTTLPLGPTHHALAAEWLLAPPVPLSLSGALHLAVAVEGDLSLMTLDPSLQEAARAVGVQTSPTGTPQTQPEKKPWASWDL